MHAQSPCYVPGTKIPMDLPGLPTVMKVKFIILLGCPRHLVPPFRLIFCHHWPSPMEAAGRQNQVSFPPGARPCLDAQNVTMSNQVLVITRVRVWGGPQRPDGRSETVRIEGVIRTVERYPPHTQSLCVWGCGGGGTSWLRPGF